MLVTETVLRDSNGDISGVIERRRHEHQPGGQRLAHRQLERPGQRRNALGEPDRRVPRLAVELGVMEQRYRAVLEVQQGAMVTDAAGRYCFARQTVQLRFPTSPESQRQRKLAKGEAPMRRTLAPLAPTATGAVVFQRHASTNVAVTDARHPQTPQSDSRKWAMNDSFPAIIGLVGVVVGALTTGVIASRRADISDAHAERREAYVAALTSVDSLQPFVEDLNRQFGTRSDDRLVKAMLSTYDGDPAVKTDAEAVITALRAELRRIGPDVRRLELLAGTPVLSKVHGVLLPLKLFPLQLKSWLDGTDQFEEWETLWQLLTFDPMSLADAMREDLARPWLVQYQDRNNRRWWRFWRR